MPSSAYPVGSGSAAIRRTILPKSRLVRWLFRPARASGSEHVSPAVRPSSPVVAVNSSAASSRFALVAPAAATNSPGCKPAGSAPAALGSSGTDDKKGESSLRLLAFLSHCSAVPACYRTAPLCPAVHLLQPSLHSAICGYCKPGNQSGGELLYRQ